MWIVIIFPEKEEGRNSQRKLLVERKGNEKEMR